MPHPGKENPQGSTFDNQLIELESVDSTNNYAMARIHEGMASDGLVCLARHQWAGKGQRGRSWLSEAGQNLIMSLVIEPAPLNLSQQFLFSAAVALGMLDLFHSVDIPNCSIKWPNDIYFNDRKAAGILIESVIRGKTWPFAVVGVGINLNQESFPAEIPHAVSLKQITGKNYEAVGIARALVPLIQNRIAILRKDPDLVLHDFNLNLYNRNKPVALKKGTELIISTILKVDALGFLHTDTGVYSLGEVSLTLNA